MAASISVREDRMATRRHQDVLLVGCCFLFLVNGAAAQTLQIINSDGQSTTFTAAQIASSPHVTVNVKDHDVPAQFEGVPLATLLSSAGIQLGDKLRGPRLTEVVTVEASDGYKVVFTLAEVDPAFATREIILANKRDGKPLDAKEGPFRIVVPGDKRPARWVRQVTVLRISSPK
jgi:hypothetical protein